MVGHIQDIEDIQCQQFTMLALKYDGVTFDPIRTPETSKPFPEITVPIENISDYFLITLKDNQSSIIPRIEFVTHDNFIPIAETLVDGWSFHKNSMNEMFGMILNTIEDFLEENRMTGDV